MKIHPMWDTYPELQMELEKTVELIEKNIKIRNKEIEATILALIHSGGKLYDLPILYCFHVSDRIKMLKKLVLLLLL